MNNGTNNNNGRNEMLDLGPEPVVLNITRATINNKNFRTTMWTGEHMQLTVMSIPVGGEIGLESHPELDQFIRIETGFGEVMMGASENRLNYRTPVSAGYAIIIPAGTWHNLINTGNRSIKLYSIYAPPAHPRGTVHATKEITDQESHEH